MLISQAGDGLRDVREDWPAFRMPGRCQMPSGMKIAGQLFNRWKGRDLSGHERAEPNRSLAWVVPAGERGLGVRCLTATTGFSSIRPIGRIGARVKLERK
jgi:hypothetical protein